MKKNLNNVKISGYVYDCSKLNAKVSGETSKNPGTPYITGDLEIATDDDAVNTVTVHFTYVTENYSKSGKPNPNYAILKRICNSEAPCSWLDVGKENAVKVQIDATLGLNDFISNDGSQVSSKRIEGSFISVIKDLPTTDRSSFTVDMLINKVSHVDANPEKNINEDYTTVNGIIFNYKNDALPYSFIVRHPEGMKHFEDLGASNSEPVYTKLWGNIISQTIKITKEEESAFGESSVSVYERKNKEYVVTGSAKIPYEFGEESVMTAEELVEKLQDREVLWAEIKKRNEEYLASKNIGNAAAATPISVNNTSNKPVFKF